MSDAYEKAVKTLDAARRELEELERQRDELTAHLAEIERQLEVVTDENAAITLTGKQTALRNQHRAVLVRLTDAAARYDDAKIAYHREEAARVEADLRAESRAFAADAVALAAAARRIYELDARLDAARSAAAGVDSLGGDGTWRRVAESLEQMLLKKGLATATVTDAGPRVVELVK